MLGLYYVPYSGPCMPVTRLAVVYAKLEKQKTSHCDHCVLVFTKSAGNCTSSFWRSPENYFDTGRGHFHYQNV